MALFRFIKPLGFMLFLLIAVEPTAANETSPSPNDCDTLEESRPGKMVTFVCPYEDLLMEYCYKCYHENDLEVIVCDGWDEDMIWQQCHSPVPIASVDPSPSSQLPANQCTATSVANSDKSLAGSISGVTGDTVTVTCTPGYSGSGVVTCQADGTFTSLTCSANPCAATAVANSDKSLAGSIAGSTGDIVAVQCDPGYSGSGDVTCQSDGTFTSLTCSVTNRPPTAVIDVIAAFANRPTLFSAFGSSDPDVGDEVVAWQWEFGDGATSSLSSPAHTYTSAGLYTITLQVTDTHGATGSATQSVTIAAPNRNPTAVIDVVPGLVDRPTIFHGGGSSDPDIGDAVVAWQWDFGDGNTDVVVAPHNTYTSAGVYEVTLVVTDTRGETGSATTFVTILAPPCPPTSVPNSDKSGVDSITGRLGDTVAVACDPGYVGSGSVTCERGSFTALLCSPNPCAPTSVPDSDKKGTASIFGTTGDTVAVTCDPGYTGSGTVTCQASGSFTPLTCTGDCQLPKDPGPCTDSSQNWFYNSNSGRCEQFTYGGCDGNANRFLTLDECQKRCVQCGPPSMPGWDFSDCPDHAYGGICNPRCVSGLRGAVTAVCDSTAGYLKEPAPRKWCPPSRAAGSI